MGLYLMYLILESGLDAIGSLMDCDVTDHQLTGVSEIDRQTDN